MTDLARFPFDCDVDATLPCGECVMCCVNQRHAPVPYTLTDLAEAYFADLEVLQND